MFFQNPIILCLTILPTQDELEAFAYENEEDLEMEQGQNIRIYILGS